MLSCSDGTEYAITTWLDLLAKAAERLIQHGKITPGDFPISH